MIDLMFNSVEQEVEDQVQQHQHIKHHHSHQIKLLHPEVDTIIQDHQMTSQLQVDQLLEELEVVHHTQHQVNVQPEDHLEEFQIKVLHIHQQEPDHHLIHQHQLARQQTFQVDQESAAQLQVSEDNQQAQLVLVDQPSVEVLIFQELQLDQQVVHHHQYKMMMHQREITRLFLEHLMSIIQFIQKSQKRHSIVINNNIQVKYCLIYKIVEIVSS
jgi:hypothetical protein